MPPNSNEAPTIDNLVALAGVCELQHLVDVEPATEGAGIRGDRQNNGSGQAAVRGHSLNLRKLNSRQVHETFCHKPCEVLRGLPGVCDDVPAEWSELKDLDETCPDCLAGKHTHFGSNSHLPESTMPGEIIAFDLLILRTPDIHGGNHRVWRH